MDPLSISASLVAVLQLTGSVIQYINSVEGTPKDRQRLLLELSTVNGMLLILQDQAEQARAGDPWYGKMITSSYRMPLRMTSRPYNAFLTRLARLSHIYKSTRTIRDSDDGCLLQIRRQITIRH